MARGVLHILYSFSHDIPFDFWEKFANVSFVVEQLGTFGRGKRKVEDMQTVIAEARRLGH